MLALIRHTALPAACASARVRTMVLVGSALILTAACADSDTAPLDGSISAAAGDDAGARGNPHDDQDDERDDPSGALDAGEPEQDGDDAEPADGAQEPDADETGEDAGEGQLDAAATGDADAQSNADAGGSDAAQEPTPDASTGDAQTDAATSDDGGCAAAQPADVCGVCGGDGSSCRHPLAGRYAARTQFYALQRASIGDTSIELVSNGSVISVVEISAAGVANEHHCFLEFQSQEPALFVWSPPATVEEIPNTSVALEQRGDRYVRPLALHRAYFSWSSQGAPAECGTGGTPVGCVCGAPDALPTDPEDCRVRDLEDDGVAGGSMYLDGELPADPNATSTQLKLNVVALLNLEWSLHPPNGPQIIGDIAGGMDQAVLSLEGELAESVDDLDNRMCNSALGHVELVRGDDFTCASILAGRATDPVGYNIFDPAYDETTPSVELCGAASGG